MTDTINKRPTRVDIQKTVGDDVLFRMRFNELVDGVAVPIDLDEPGTSVVAKLWETTVVDFKRVSTGAEAAEQWTVDTTTPGQAVAVLTDAQTQTLGSGFWIYWVKLTRNGVTHTYFNGELELYSPGALE